MSALTVTLGADITSMKRSLGGAMGVISGFAKRISGAFSLKGGIVGALAGGSTAALAAKLNATGEAGNTANAQIQSVARSMGAFGEDSPDPQGASSDPQTWHLAILLRLNDFGKGHASVEARTRAGHDIAGQPWWSSRGSGDGGVPITRWLAFSTGGGTRLAGLRVMRQ